MVPYAISTLSAPGEGEEEEEGDEEKKGRIMFWEGRERLGCCNSKGEVWRRVVFIITEKEGEDTR